MLGIERVRFDAYTATMRGISPRQLVELVGGRPGDEVRQGRGFHTFAERLSVVDVSGDQVGAVQYGGSQGDRVMVEVKGERSPAVVEALRALQPHRATRLDSCVDVERPGAFDELLGPVLQVKADHRLYGERRGDWEFPELGRTQYLGAPSSAVRSRLYEKGRQPEFRHLGRFDLARLEVQVRPQKDAKEVYATLSAVEVWGASKWTRQLAEAVLLHKLDPHPPGTIRRDTKTDQALRWMVKQYGVHLLSLQAELGSWECVGLTLREMIQEADAERARFKRLKGRAS